VLTHQTHRIQTKNNTYEGFYTETHHGLSKRKEGDEERLSIHRSSTKLKGRRIRIITTHEELKP